MQRVQQRVHLELRVLRLLQQHAQRRVRAACRFADLVLGVRERRQNRVEHLCARKASGGTGKRAAAQETLVSGDSDGSEVLEAGAAEII